MLEQEKYYEQAFREIEAGYRRDGLWGKAFSRSKGDLQKAKAIYLDMLAQHLESEANAPAKKEKKVRFRFTIKRWAVRLFVIGLGVIALSQIASTLYDDYTRDWAANRMFSNFESANEKPRIMADARGNLFTEPTREQYYEAVVARSTGASIDSFTEVQKDLATLNQSEIFGKYGEAGSSLIMGSASAWTDYSNALANPPTMIEAALDALGLGNQSRK